MKKNHQYQSIGFAPLFWGRLLMACLLLVFNQAMAQCKLQLDLSQWSMVFNDNFDDPTFANWYKDTHGRGLEGNSLYDGWGDEYFDPAQVSRWTDSQGNNYARLTASPWVVNGNYYSFTTPKNRTVRYKSGMLQLNDNVRMPSYGIYEMRARLPNSELAWPTFWLLSCPTEIDILDGGGRTAVLSNVIDTDCNDPSPYPQFVDTNHRLKHCTHLALPWAPPGQTNTMLVDQFNTFTMAWTPSKVTFFINGRETHTVLKSQVLTNPHWPYLFANLQMYHGQGNLEIKDVYMDIDYIRIYKPRYSDANGNPNYDTTPFSSTHEMLNYNVSVGGINPAPRPNVATNVSSVAGSLAINPDISDGRQVFYRGTDNHIWVAKQPTAGGDWNTVDLGRPNLGSPLGPHFIAGDLVYSPNRNGLVYKGTDQRMYLYYHYSSTAWRLQLLGNMPGASKPQLTPVNATVGAIAIDKIDGKLFWIGTDNLIHVTSSMGPDFDETTLTNTEPNQWAVQARGDLCVIPNYVFYKGMDDRVQYYAWYGGAYHHFWADDSWGSSDPYIAQVSQKPKSLVVQNGGTVYYVGKADDKLHRLQYVGGSPAWSHVILPQGYAYGNQTGYLDADKIKGGLDYFDNGTGGARLTYLGYDGRIQNIYSSDRITWLHEWIDNYWNTSEFLSFNSNTVAQFPNSYSSLITDADDRVFYCDRYNTLRYFKWESCQNNSTDAQCLSGSNGNTYSTSLNRNAHTKTATAVGTVREELLVSPNPTTGWVNIQWSSKQNVEPVSYAIYSMSGIVVEKGVLDSKQFDLDISDYKSGLYLLVIQGSKQVLRATIVKQ